MASSEVMSHYGLSRVASVDELVDGRARQLPLRVEILADYASADVREPQVAVGCPHDTRHLPEDQRQRGVRGAARRHRRNDQRLGDSAILVPHMAGTPSLVECYFSISSPTGVTPAPKDRDVSWARGG